jgi:phosphoenolpyruvate carboxylase
MTLHNRDLGRDVRELGDLLGDVIREQAAEDVFDAVEDVRTGSVDYRNGEADSRDAVRRRLGSNDETTNAAVARAFTTYFVLTNLAEERERVRSLRRGEQDDTLTETVDEAVSTLAAQGFDAEEVTSVLDDVLVQPTFTAHPTEARRKTVKAKLRTVSTLLRDLDERRLTDEEREDVERDLAAEVVSLWQTAYLRDHKPEPSDEARNVQWYLENTLFDVVPDVYDAIEEAVEREFDESVDVPSVVEFRSWAGSDRDGNPFVTPEVTTETLDRQREVAIERYTAELSDLLGVLSQDADAVETGADFEETATDLADELPRAAESVAERYPDEPYRQAVSLMRERLHRVTDVRPGGYDDPEELAADLDAIATDLRANDAESIADRHVDPLRRQVETFGFSLASMDLRDHQQMHTTAVSELFDREDVDYAGMDEGERVDLLTDAIVQDDPVVDLSAYADDDSLSDDARRVVRRFDHLTDWHERFGAEAIDAYCISMTEEPSHVLEVLFLADQADVVDLPGYCGLDVIPLLETESALDGARRIMGTLFENEAYEAALSARGDTQEVMLGYSDSNKENGYLAANWSLYRNQRRLAAIADEFDVELRLFHGRGGSISRGGGPMNEALLALPPETVTGEVKFTEQGEAIAEKYGTPRIAERELEQMLNAQIRARAQALENPTADVEEEWTDAMATMADAARDEYRDFLETEGFVSYFEQATPITVIENLNLGSRPASRSGERTVEDLRAIPWVFSWTQSRCILPGWYAVGTGIQAYLDDGGSVETLQEMYDEWPFFRTTLDNAALSMGRTEMDIAAEYAGLADSELRDRFFPRIREEYERGVGHVLDVVDRDHLVDREWLRESLDRRNPYVDPLNMLQVQLLGSSHRTETAEHALRLTVAGIAAGMKDTG